MEWTYLGGWTSMGSCRTHRCRRIPSHSWTPTMPNMKKTKKHSSSTLPSMGNVSSNSITRIRIPFWISGQIAQKKTHTRRKWNHYTYTDRLEFSLFLFDLKTTFMGLVFLLLGIVQFIVECGWSENNTLNMGWRMKIRKRNIRGRHEEHDNGSKSSKKIVCNVLKLNTRRTEMNKVNESEGKDKSRKRKLQQSALNGIKTYVD